MDELLADFVAETREMLEASESEIIAWEADPSDAARLDAIFRFVHTVKGNCGFFDFPRLAALSHAAEDTLADCRSGEREADEALVSAVLAIIDRIARMVDAIEAGTEFPTGGDEALVDALEPGDRAATAPLPGNDPVSQPEERAGDGTGEEPGEPTEPEAGADTPSSPQPNSAAPAVQRTIRLPVDLLDRVMSGVSDMVLARNDLAHRLRQVGTQPTIDGPFERLTSILSDVREAITRMRMQRVETLFAALPRLVRDLGTELGKPVEIATDGGDVELDREMIEMIRDPVTHIIRNAIDHGIEPPAGRVARGKRDSGLIAIAARQSGNTIAITISDDGGGLDERRIADKAVSSGILSAEQRAAMPRDAILQLVFRPGFSTADEVSTVSGRGVGLDVVRDNLERVGGSIAVSSKAGHGTVFTLQIPLTLSIIAGLTVEVGRQRFAIPQSFIEEIIHASASSLDFTRVGETALVTFRDRRVPCLMLREVLDLPPADLEMNEHTMVLLRLAGGDLLALGVERIHAHGDLVVKPLAPVVSKCGLYAGSTLLDDGEPVLLLDIANIASRHDLVAPMQERALRAPGDEDGETAAGATTRAMVFTGMGGRRSAIRLELVRRIETACASVIDRTGTRPRAVLDGRILPVAGLPADIPATGKIRLLRLSDGRCELLLAVSSIEDAIELDGEMKPVTDDPVIEALTLVEGKPTALIDSDALFARFGEISDARARPRCRVPDSEWSRTFLAPLVRSAGYEVVLGCGDEGEDADADSLSADVVIALTAEPGSAEADSFPSGAAIIRLREELETGDPTDTIYRYDREAVLAALRDAQRVSGDTV